LKLLHRKEKKFRTWDQFFAVHRIINWLIACLTCIRKVCGSDVNKETDCPDRILVAFMQCYQLTWETGLVSFNTTKANISHLWPFVRHICSDAKQRH
jgi:hypothetical protein